MHRLRSLLLLALALLLSVVGCQSTANPSAAGQPPGGLRVLATTTFLADIAQNVAGDRLRVESLLPLEVNPHGFQATPADVVKVSQSQVLIVNGQGFESFLDDILRNADGSRDLVEAAHGLEGRRVDEAEGEGHEGEFDPHYWLAPSYTVRYVENIRAGLAKADPAGTAVYEANARAYVAKLEELDRWIAQQVDQLPAAERKLVTNHESFGYFAERYGFAVVGTVVSGTSSEASPSAQTMSELIQTIRQTQAKAIFLETGSSPQLAQQVARETGAKVVTNLHSESLSGPNGPAPTYLEMMRHNTLTIVEALK